MHPRDLSDIQKARGWPLVNIRKKPWYLAVNLTVQVLEREDITTSVVVDRPKILLTSTD